MADFFCFKIFFLSHKNTKSIHDLFIIIKS